MKSHCKSLAPPGPVSVLRLWGWYAVFGLLHELAHLASFVGATKIFCDDATASLTLITNSGVSLLKAVINALFRACFGRYSILPALDSVQNEEVATSISFVTVHAGWIFSLALAIVLHICCTKLQMNIPIIACIAAYVTALEALGTDLLGFVPRSLAGFDSSTIVFCGNFGIILLNHKWMTDDNGKTALDVLEKMVNVTMMRGAQCGGVVTFSEKETDAGKTGDRPHLEGIRSRVVNAKRTDLSKGVRAKIEKDNYNFGRLKGFRRGFFGHTRFATTSKATFDGCHPHQWSIPQSRTVYHPFAPGAALSTKASNSRVQVSNYVTHNGDFDYYLVNGKTFALDAIQGWLEHATECKMPTTVDSCAIAGVVDILRTQGSFGLSARYAICLGMPSSKINPQPSLDLPCTADYDAIGDFFENALDEMLEGSTLDQVSVSNDKRNALAAQVSKKIHAAVASADHPYSAIELHMEDEESGGGWETFVRVTINAFFDNDLFHCMKEFLSNAKGSFGLMVTSSLDAHRQVCVAARGQTISVAFYPNKGLICYGSEQAAVKAGLGFDTPGGDIIVEGEGNEAVRLDLDDLGGEICLLDWGYEGDVTPCLSPPNRDLKAYSLIQGSINVVLLQESKITPSMKNLRWRMTPLEGNEWVQPLQREAEDMILKDIHDIPRVCNDIQYDWRGIGLNRMTAWNLMKCVSERLQSIVDGKVSRHSGSIDILLTGCEVSLWMSEQFATDLQKCFPKLFVKAVSSNKLLGLFGQEISIPCVGYPMSTKTNDLSDAIVIIVSHSGGTFAPLACSNLLQAFTRNIFVVASEWDTQIGKQLRSMHSEKDFLSSRIFSTGIGVRPAEPCSISVAATHQLLTNIFIYLCDVIIGSHQFRHVSGALVTETDLKILERCNGDNIEGLEAIVGVDVGGNDLPLEYALNHQDLRKAGALWANHILENVKAYVMSFIYIVVTVTIGYPLVTGVCAAAGMTSEWAFYISRFVDSLVYFFLPQINVIILRLFEGRNLLHRMVGRTIVIGDTPWVAQSAEAFLGKIFACSYSIAGCNVLSGNPADHLVHRHTHRVVRGSLLVCGRPDGRLSALTSLEATVCLSVNQASSIQSIGGTCESITVGHNPYKLPLSHAGIFLDTTRPKFMCEAVLDHLDRLDSESRVGIEDLPKVERIKSNKSVFTERRSSFSRFFVGNRMDQSEKLETNSLDSSHHRLLGVYSDLQRGTNNDKNSEARDPMKTGAHKDVSVELVLAAMLKETKGLQQLREMFDEMDADKGGTISLDEFLLVYRKYDPSISEEVATKIFLEADTDENGLLDFDEFVAVAKMPQIAVVSTLQARNRTARGLTIVQASKEKYFGEEIRQSSAANISSFNLSKSQELAMELYESRIASMQRFVAMTVMFHEIGLRVQSWFYRNTFGLMGYRMDRTHSIMRIATTASPVSGADVRERMEYLKLVKTVEQSVDRIKRSWLRYRDAQVKEALSLVRKISLPMKTETYPVTENSRVSMINHAGEIHVSQKSLGEDERKEDETADDADQSTGNGPWDEKGEVAEPPVDAP